jgi:hypothetical protein
MITKKEAAKIAIESYVQGNTDAFDTIADLLKKLKSDAPDNARKASEDFIVSLENE